MFVPEYAEYKEQKVRPNNLCDCVFGVLTAVTGVRRLAQERQEVRRGLSAENSLCRSPKLV